MTVAEFKAWFEGFAENIGYAPDFSQWGKLKAKVALIGDQGEPPPAPPSHWIDYLPG